jgi:iron complex transport system substrate-binding protein
MVQHALRFALSCALCLSPLWGSAQVRVLDDRGDALVLPHAPQRIVSLLPSITETVCALQQCHRLVGVDRYSDFPPSVKTLPQMGGGLDPNIEAIVAARPDVVLMARSSRATPRLKQLGIQVLELEPLNYKDIERVTLTLGHLLQVDHAQALWQSIERDLTAAAQQVPPQARGARVYFEASLGGYAASESSFIGETLQRLGLANVVPAALGQFPKLNPEFVARANPDLIMTGEHTAQELAKRPGWQSLPAVRAGHVCAFASADANTLVRPGPRIAQGAQAVVECLRHTLGAPS